MTYRNVILLGDVREKLRELPDESVHCVVTSPPYWGLRDYGAEGQLGLEPTPEQFVCNLVDVFREVRRVLRADGTVFLNLGDSYAGSGRGMNKDGTPNGGAKQQTNAGSNLDFHDRLVEQGAIGRFWVAPPDGLKPKDMVGIPWRVAFALQADGWWLRSDIIWSKPNPMPESVYDRPTKAHEYVFLLSKSARYFYDDQAIKEPVKFPQDNLPEDHERAFTALRANGPTKRQDAYRSGNTERKFRAQHGGNPDLFNAHQGHSIPWEYSGGGRNKRTVWEIPTEPYSEAHFATYPTALVLPCIKAGTAEHGCCGECGAPWRRVTEVSDPEGRLGAGYHDHTDDLGRGQRGVPGAEGAPVKKTVGWAATCKHHQPGAGMAPAIVLDPFMGSGTTAVVAKGAGRDYVGVELNPEYLEMAKRRIGDQGRLL